MNKTQLKAAVAKATIKARELYPTFLPPIVGFYEKGTVAGRAYYLTHKVEFNLTLARENSEEFENTVIHEVAHLVTKHMYPRAKQAHGPEFKRVFIAMGGNGKRCHSYDVSTAKREVVRTYVVYKCACQEHMITPATHKKINTGMKSFKCRMCGTRLSMVPNEKGNHVKVVKVSNKAK